MAGPTSPPPPPGYEPVAAASPPPPAGYEPVGGPGLLESFGRGAVEGATFGFDDQLGFDKEKRAASQKANPWTHFMGELVGGALPMVGAALLPTGVTQAAAGARGAQLASKGAGLVRAALAPGEINTLGQAVQQGAKLGSVYGGLSGAGHADVAETDTLPDSLAKRGVGAVKGATIGTLIGAPMGAAGHGLYRGAQNMGNLLAEASAETAGAGKGALVTATKRLERDQITPQQIIDNIRAEFPDATQAVAGGPGAPLARRFWGDIGNKQPITSDQVETAVRMSMAGETPSAISAALSPGGKGTGPGEQAVKTLMDELAQRHLGPLNLVDRAALARTGAGDNTQMAMRAAAATPGEHLGIAREGLLERQVGAQGRMGQLFDRMLGSSDYEGVASKHATDFQNAGARAYHQAFANERPFDLAPIFNAWEAQFDRMRGVIPDSMRQRLRSMMWEEKNSAGQTVRTPPENLQGFMYAREGVRDLIDELPKGNNLRRHLTQFYDQMTDEVARTNPLWKEANQIWRDGKAAQEALDAGARMTTRLNAGSRENLAEFTTARSDGAKAAKELRDANKPINAALKKNPQYQPTPQEQASVEAAQARLDAANSRQELFKVGLVRSLNDMLQNQGETHNLTKQLLLPGAQKMLRQVLGKDADQFFKTVRAEQAMHRTYQSQFGSQTTPLREHVDELNWAPRFEASMLNPLTWANPAIRLAQEYAARNINARRNTDLMRLYTETDPLKQLEALRAMQSLHQARSQAGNLVGKPAIGLGSGVLPEAEIAREAAELERLQKLRHP